MPRFLPCHSGWHYWPKHLSQNADACCKGTDDPRPEETRPFYQCHSGEHWWRSEEKSLQCCDTHIRVWVDVTNPWFKEALGEKWGSERKLILMPLTEFAKLDEKATTVYRGMRPKLV